MHKFKKTHSLNQLVKQNSNDSKILFKLINKIAGKRDQNPLPAPKSNKDLAGRIFMVLPNKIEKNKRTNLSLHQLTTPITNTCLN